MITTVAGIKVNLCSDDCKESYQRDRACGLIYPPYNVDGIIMGVDKASIEACFCAYCGDTIEEEK